ISFSHSQWTAARLPATEVTLDSDSNLAERAVVLPNIALEEHFADHRPWISERRRREIASTQILLDRRGELFPHLDFSTTALRQLAGITASHLAFDLIVERLFEIERNAVDRGANFDASSFATKCNPSSASTLQMFGDAYTFSLENGNAFLCGWHFYLPTQ